jgi:hypothetical protein
MSSRARRRGAEAVSAGPKHEISACSHVVSMRTAREWIDLATTRRIAALADVDPRSVDRVILGKPTRDSIRLRVLAVLEKAGILPPEPAATDPKPSGEGA